MEDLAAVLIGVVAGLLGVFFGLHRAPKNKTAREMQEFYEHAMQRLKKEIQRLNGQVTYYKKGAIPSNVESDSPPDAVIDAVLNAMPPNFRSMIAPFKAQILQHAKENPEVVNTVIEVIKAKAGKAENGETVNQDAI